MTRWWGRRGPRGRWRLAPSSTSPPAASLPGCRAPRQGLATIIYNRFCCSALFLCFFFWGFIIYAMLYKTLHSTLYTLHSTLYTLHSTLYTLHPTLYTLTSTPYTLHPKLYTLHSTLYTLNSTLYTLNSTLYTLNSTL